MYPGLGGCRGSLSCDSCVFILVQTEPSSTSTRKESWPGLCLGLSILRSFQTSCRGYKRQDTGKRVGAWSSPEGSGEGARLPLHRACCALISEAGSTPASSPSSYGLRHKVRNKSLPGATFARRRESRGESEPSQDANAFGVNTSTCRRDLVCVVV